MEGMPNEGKHLLLFLIICAVAFWRANLPNFTEKGVFIRASVVGDVFYEEGSYKARVKILESDIRELEGRKAFLMVFGYMREFPKEIIFDGKVKVRNNKVFIYAQARDIEGVVRDKSIRDWFIGRYEQVSSDKEMVPLGKAFLFGEPRDLLPARVQKDFLQSGLVHLLVVSGLHVGTIALVLSYMLPRFWGLKLALVGVILYSTLLVNTEPPILRATIMTALVILALLSFRRPNGLAILLFSGSAILGLYPHYLFSYSFWMSFVATAYIILAIRGLNVDNKIKTLIASLSAFTGVSPLVATFSGISPMSVIFTPLLSPVVLLYSLFGILSLITFMSFPPFVDIFNLMGRIFELSVAYLSDVSFRLYPQLSVTEAFILLSVGAFFLYVLRGFKRLVPLFAINSYLTLKAIP